MLIVRGTGEKKVPRKTATIQSSSTHGRPKKTEIRGGAAATQNYCEKAQRVETNPPWGISNLSRRGERPTNERGLAKGNAELNVRSMNNRGMQREERETRSFSHKKGGGNRTRLSLPIRSGVSNDQPGRKGGKFGSFGRELTFIMEKRIEKSQGSSPSKFRTCSRFCCVILRE